MNAQQEPIMQNAAKTYKQVLGMIKYDGLMQLLAWLMASSTFLIEVSHVPKGPCLGVAHQDADPKDDEYLNLDIRVLGRTIKSGYIQLL